MLRVSNLTKSYGPQVLLKNASFMLSSGERVGLVGRNGYGKTTLFRIILGTEEIDEGEVFTPKNYTIGHLSQHLHFTEPNILEEACLALPEQEGGWKETYKAEETLAGLGFNNEDFLKAPAELSGGFQIRLNLAKVLLSDPNLLLLDEPTNYLDIVSVRWLTRFLKNWEREMIIITHDRDFMDGVTTHSMVIHRQNIRKVEGPTSKLYAQILLEEEIYEKTRLNEQKKRDEIEKFINRFRAQATRAAAVQSRVKALARTEKKEQLSTAKNLDFSFTAQPFTCKWLMEAEDVGFGYTEDDPLIKKLSLAVGSRDRIGIIGKNGKGKTTLLNLLAGELTPTAGNVSKNTQCSIGYFGQTNIDRLNLKNTVEKEIIDCHPTHSRGVARSICGVMMFEGDTALKPISVLSGGERSRVLLGKLLITPANLLLLDEPTNHLDMESIDSLVEAIEEFPGAVIIVTHSELILRAVATRLVVFDREKTHLFEGTYDDFLFRLGWSSEDSPDGPTQHSDSHLGGGVDSGISKKELRKLRAERTKTIGPLKKQVDEIEEKIMSLEQEVVKGHEELAKVSATQEVEKITSLSTSVNDATKKIARLFQDLEKATAALESAEKEFPADDQL